MAMNPRDEKKAMLIDTTRCIGCRSCQVACKQWHELSAEKTLFFNGSGYQNPPNLSEDTYTLVTYTEIEDKDKISWTFVKRQCMHCDEPACVAACLVGALTKSPTGAVVYDKSRCIGCRYCLLACPWEIPKYQWRTPLPYVCKCDLCETRLIAGVLPACAKACPSGAIKFGNKTELLAEAGKRIKMHPDKYINHIYGEKEAGGTSVLYLSAVPFDKLGFPRVPDYPRAFFSDRVMHVLPYWSLCLGIFLSGLYWHSERKTRVSETERKEPST